MSRDFPIIFSLVLGIPLLGLGAYVYIYPSEIIQFYNIGYMFSPDRLQLYGGVPMIVFGTFILLIGLYVQFVSPTEPTLQEQEEIVDSKSPSQRVAYSNIAASLPFFAVTFYLLFFTLLPYIYPTVSFFLGLYFLSTGLKTYWINSLTAYYITSQRVISEYRFVSLRRQEIPLDKVRGIEERKSIREAIVGLGNVRVASGGGGGSVQLKIRNINNSTEFADEIRSLT